MTYYRDKNKALNEAEKRSRKTGQQQFVREHDGCFSVSNIDIPQPQQSKNADFPLALILALAGAKRLASYRRFKV